MLNALIQKQKSAFPDRPVASHVFLQQCVPTAGDLVLEPDIGERLVFRSCQLILLLLHQLHAVQLLGPLLVQLLHPLAEQLDRLLMAGEGGGALGHGDVRWWTRGHVRGQTVTAKVDR